MHFEREVSLEALEPVMLDVAGALAGRALTWGAAERVTSPDENFGPGECFASTRRAEGGSLSLSVGNDGFGNPRDGAGYYHGLELELGAAEALIRIRHGQGGTGAATRWLRLELETAPPERRRAVFEALRSELFASLARRGVGARDETAASTRCLLNVSLVGHTDPAWAVALADEGVAAGAAGAHEDRASLALLIEQRVKLGPAPDLLATRLALAPMALDAWISARAQLPAGVKLGDVEGAIARLTPHDREAVLRSRLAKIASVWLGHPLSCAEPWAPLGDARAPALDTKLRVPADSGWLHAEDGLGITERPPAAYAIAYTLMPTLVEGDRDGTLLPDGAQKIRRYACRQGKALLFRVDVEHVREAERRAWTFFFGPGPLDALVVLQVFFSVAGPYGSLVSSPPWIARAVGSNRWVEKATQAASRAARWGLHPGGALPNLARAEVDGREPLDVVASALEELGRGSDAVTARAAMASRDLGALRAQYAALERPGAFGEDAEQRAIAAITLGAVQAAMAVVGQDDSAVVESLANLRRQRAWLLCQRGAKPSPAG